MNTRFSCKLSSIIRKIEDAIINIKKRHDAVKSREIIEEKEDMLGTKNLITKIKIIL